MKNLLTIVAALMIFVCTYVVAGADMTVKQLTNYSNYEGVVLNPGNERLVSPGVPRYVYDEEETDRVSLDFLDIKTLEVQYIVEIYKAESQIEQDRKSVIWDPENIEDLIIPEYVCDYKEAETMSLDFLDFSNIETLKVQYVFRVYPGDSQLGQVVDINLVDVNTELINPGVRVAFNPENGLLSPTQIDALLQILCVEDTF